MSSKPLPVNFITVAVGTKYNTDYPNFLYRMVKRHYQGDFRFWCVTDHPEGLHPDITPIAPLENVTGWWTKLMLFSPAMPPGRLVYLDLDVVILSDITEIVDGYTGDYCGDEDHVHFGSYNFGMGNHLNGLPPIDCSLGTAFVMMKSGHAPHVWKHYLNNRVFVETVFSRHGDQVYTSWQLGGKFDLLERLYPGLHGFYSYKFNVLGQRPERLIDHRIVAPEECRFINFHGDPKPLALLDTVPWLREAYEYGV